MSEDTDCGSGEILEFDGDAAGLGVRELDLIYAHFGSLRAFWRHFLAQNPLDLAFGHGDELATALWQGPGPGIAVCEEIFKAFEAALGLAGGKADGARKSLDTAGENAVGTVTGTGKH